MLHCYTKPFGLKENTVLIPVEFSLHQYKLRTEQKELKLNQSVSDVFLMMIPFTAMYVHISMPFVLIWLWLTPVTVRTESRNINYISISLKGIYGAQTIYW